MIKNLYVLLPEIPPFFSLRTRSFFRLNRLFLQRKGFEKNIAIIDLSQLKETLAIHLKGVAKRVQISDNEQIKFERLNVKNLLDQQSQLLRTLLEEQKKQLKEQSKNISEQERARIHKKYNFNHRN